jgi:hypothetical protein
MRKGLRLTFALLAVLLALSLSAGQAAAHRSIQLNGGERVHSSGTVTFGPETMGRLLAEQSITCDITILKTVARAFPKTPGTTFGKITGVAIDRGEPAPHCRAGAGIGTVLKVIPLIGPGRPGVHTEPGRGILLYDVSGSEAGLWRMIFDTFQGTLPRITSIDYHIAGAQILFEGTEVFGRPLSCLYEGSMYKRMAIDETGQARILRILLERTVLTRIVGGFPCPARLSVSGELTLTPTLTIRLL